MADKYTAPKGLRIGADKTTRRLYALEAKRDHAIRDAAHELGKVLKHGDDALAFWRDTMPEALLSVLDGYSPELVRVVVAAWLEKDREERAAEQEEST